MGTVLPILPSSTHSTILHSTQPFLPISISDEQPTSTSLNPLLEASPRTARNRGHSVPQHRSSGNVCGHTCSPRRTKLIDCHVAWRPPYQPDTSGVQSSFVSRQGCSRAKAGGLQAHPLLPLGAFGIVREATYFLALRCPREGRRVRRTL